MEQHKPSPNAPSNSRQVESLHQISIPSNYEPIDLLVIDEVDATNSTACDLYGCQPGPSHSQHLTADESDWIGSILKALSSGQKIVIPMNCLKDAKAIEELLRSQFSGKKIELYSNETLPSKKKEHFGDVHTDWSELDVLIYTPTVSAGISFESVHFDAIFACFTDNSCDIETCRQMLARVRNLSTREHFICFRLVNTCHSLPVTTDAISQQLHDKRTGLYQTVSDVALQFVDLVAYTGARVNVLPTHDPDDVKAHQTSFRMIKTDLENAHCEAVASSPKITDVYAFDIYERLENEEDVTVQEKNSFKKFNLLNFYDFGEEISPEFVKNYSKPAVKQVFTNLENITRGKTVDEALLKMRDHELKRYTDILGMEW
ncbi:hypothetical protein RhiirB3_451966 [Rhizophagus irregularis]|nr:hypothetical protein RhiirB3_451966 [Rhizophagus irregularis]